MVLLGFAKAIVHLEVFRNTFLIYKVECLYLEKVFMNCFPATGDLHVIQVLLLIISQASHKYGRMLAYRHSGKSSLYCV